MFGQQQYDDDDERSISTGGGGGNSSSAVNQSHFEAFQRLQQRASETIRAFTTTPIVSAAGGGKARRGGAEPAGPPTGEEGRAEPVSLDEYWAQMYNKDMNRKWANEAEEYGDDAGDDEEQGEPFDAEDDLSMMSERETRSEQDEEDEHAPRQRREKRRRLTSVADGGDGGDDRRKRQCTREYDTRTRNECFLCAWGNKFHDGIEAPHVNKLIDIIHVNYGVHHNKEIANELHLYFKHEIYDAASGMEMLTRQVALEHIEGLHTLDARIFLGESIREQKQLAFLFKNRIWRSDGTFDKIAAEEFRKCTKELRELYKMKLGDMNFNNGNSAEDMKRAANYINLMMPRFDQRTAAAPKPRRPTATPPTVTPSRKRFT